MTDYSTLSNNIKRRIFHYCEKLGSGLSRPKQKFIADMTYGILGSQSSHLTKMARSLNENIALDKTVERLSRNLMNFDDTEALTENYFNAIKSHFDDKTVLLIDDSDISKPYSRKLEGLCKVRDGSTGEITDGYWTVGVSALTANKKQPIPVYSRVYSSTEQEYVSNNHEALKALEFVSTRFSNNNIRALDRGYDSGTFFNYFISKNEKFIIRTVGNRNCEYNGQTILINELAHKYKGKFSLKFESKDGEKLNCKISIVPVSLPKHLDTPLNLIICRGFGKEPLLLLSNLESDDPRLCVTIVKVYLMRWRIEEYYRFKKQAFNFEKFLVRSLDSIRNLDMLLSMTIGFIGVLSEKVNDSIEVKQIIQASKRLYGLALFTFYAISDGLANIFSKSRTGIKPFFLKPKPSPQLTLWKTV